MKKNEGDSRFVQDSQRASGFATNTGCYEAHGIRSFYELLI